MEEIRLRGDIRPCGSQEPHLYHRTGSYGTVRYGVLPVMCPGVAGDIDGRQVSVERVVRGTPEAPAVYRVTVDPGRDPARARLEDGRGRRCTD